MKYFLWFLGSVGLIILTFILIFHTFSGGSKQTITPLVSYANTDTTVQLTEHGPVVADQNYQGYRITIGQSESEIVALQGYSDAITNTRVYPNNPTGYAQFLRALDLAGFQKGNTSASAADSRGYCATGDVYTLEIFKDGTSAQKFWTSSCGMGSFNGNLGRVTALFRSQIPDFDLVAGQLRL